MNFNLIVKIKNKLEEINKQKVSSLLKIAINISIFLLTFAIHYFMFSIIFGHILEKNDLLAGIFLLLESILILINTSLLIKFKNTSKIIINKITNQINKIKVSNILNKDEKEYLKTKNINLLFNYNIKTFLRAENSTANLLTNMII